jgi:hypothetical protein
MQASSSSSSANSFIPTKDPAHTSAKTSLLLAGKLTPSELRYYEGQYVSPDDLTHKLMNCLAELVGGNPYCGLGSREPCRYIPPRGWASFERAQERLEVLKEVYPELTLNMLVMVEKSLTNINRPPYYAIRWTELVLGIEYDQLLEIS